MRVVHIQRHRAHLNSVSIIGRILKKTIIWIEHLTRQKEKELPRWSAIIQTETAKKTSLLLRNVLLTEWFSNNYRGKTETREFYRTAEIKLNDVSRNEALLSVPIEIKLLSSPYM